MMTSQQREILTRLFASVDIDCEGLLALLEDVDLKQYMPALIFHLSALPDHRYDEVILRLLDRIDSHESLQSQLYCYNTGQRVLHYAVLHNKLSVVEKMLRLGFSTEIKMVRSRKSLEQVAREANVSIDMFWLLYQRKYGGDLVKAMRDYAGHDATDMSKFSFCTVELAIQAMQSGFAISADQITVESLEGFDFSTCVVYPPVSREGFSARGVDLASMPQQGYLVACDEDLLDAQMPHIRFLPGYKISSVEALQALRKMDFDLRRFDIEPSVCLLGYNLRDFKFDQITARQYYELLAENNPDLTDKIGGLKYIHELAENLNKKIADFTNGELYSFRKGLESILTKVEDRPSQELVNQHLLLIDHAFKQSLTLSQVQSLFRLQRVREFFQQEVQVTEYMFFHKPVAVRPIPEISETLDMLFSTETASQDDLCLVLWRMVNAYNAYIQEHTDSNYMQSPMNPVNRLFLLLTWTLAHIRDYPLSSMIQCVEFQEIGASRVSFEELSLSESTILSRGRGTVALRDLEYNLREKASLSYLDTQTENYDECEIPPCDWVEVFEAMPHLIDVVYECHEEDLKRNKVKVLPEELLQIIYKYGQLFANNSIDVPKNGDFEWDGQLYPKGYFNQALSVELQAGFQRELDKFSEVDRAALDSVQIYVEARRGKTTFNKLWSEMTYNGCSGQLGFAMMQYANGYRQMAESGAIRMTSYSCFLTSCQQAQQRLQRHHCAARLFSPRAGFDNHESAVTQLVMRQV